MVDKSTIFGMTNRSEGPLPLIFGKGTVKYSCDLLLAAKGMTAEIEKN